MDVQKKKVQESCGVAGGESALFPLTKRSRYRLAQREWPSMTKCP